MESELDRKQWWWKDGETKAEDWQARAERAEAALAQCQHDLAEMIERKEVLRNCWEGAEAALAARDALCECGLVYRGFTMYGNKFCPNCGHPVPEPQP